MMDQLAKTIADLNFDPKSDQGRIVVSQLVEASSSNEDTTCLIGPVMKLLPSLDLGVKKSIHHILPRLCKKHPQAAVLAVNCVLHDCGDPNPEVKCLGVASICAIPEFTEHVSGVVQTLLSDPHPKVRLAAVNGCRALHKHSPAAPLELGLIDILYSLVRDSDSKVSTAAILTLDFLLAEEGGVIVTKAMAKHLLRRLGSYPPPQLASVLQALAKYKPKEEAEIFEELSLIDPYLVYSQYSAVNVNSINLFLTLIEGPFEHLVDQLVQRSSPSLVEYLSSTSESTATLVINFLSGARGKNWLQDLPSASLVPRMTDSSNVKMKKMALLSVTCRNDEVEKVLTSITPFCYENSCGQQAIQCLCEIRAKFESSASKCLSVILQLLDSPDPQVLRNTLAGVEKFSFEGIPSEEILKTLEKIVDRMDLFKPESIPSVLPHLLGLHGETLPTAPYILEHLVNNYEQLTEETRMFLLVGTLRLFLKQPGECQLTLGRLFQFCVNDCDNILLSEKATKFYKILTYDPELMKAILGVN
ncbi:AP-4 complex subunit beta-1-like [Neocloeon triangulifer]|uniref:AP-4 complex subunit beta-1-like n=1 Tax=Neocloeon triangulifer TaxID=2078957 RepID=UPI00286F091C|nr:AP-4 complex subunit beta-1-like [Neocloeon triangulifer]